MTPIDEEKAKSIIARQMEMSGRTLDALRRAGLSDQTKIQLEFFFNAPNENAAKSLVADLGRKDCLDLSVKKTGSVFFRKYIVEGKTYKTQVTTAVLAQWLPWIVVQGFVHGCEFDGWGAEV